MFAASEKFVGVPAMPLIMFFFSVWTALSAALCWCMSVGMYWICVCCSVMKCSNNSDVLILSLLTHCLKLHVWSKLYHFGMHAAVLVGRSFS